MPLLGAHMSIAGGYYKAVEAASRAGCDCVQLFTKNNNQWRAKPITEDDVARFASSLRELKIKLPVSHASYLINLASPNDELWRKSIDAMTVEVQRAELLGIFGVVLHPGSFTTSSEEAGLKRIAMGLDEVHKHTRGATTRMLLENTAGQGSNLGWRFEHLAAIIDKCRDPDRLGVCIDTCHAFAAGYAMETEKEFKSTVRQLNQTVGVAKVKALHLNDSKKPFGSRVDRHAHIGRGEMGLAPFHHLMNDRRFAKKPMYLETPKGEERGRDLDAINLAVLRGLVE